MFCSDSQGHRSCAYLQREKLTLRKPLCKGGRGVKRLYRKALQKGSIEILGVGMCGAGNDMDMFPTNVKQASSLSFIVHVEQCLRTGVSQHEFLCLVLGLFCCFLFCIKQVLPRTIPKEDKTRNPQ